MESQVASEPMSLGSPTSPKLTSGAQFLPGFLMGDPPAPASPQPRPFSLTMPLTENTSSNQGGGGGSALQPIVPTPKDKSGAPPVRSIYDDLVTAGTPLSAYKQSFPGVQSPLCARQASTPGTGVQQVCLSPAQVDPFYSQGESLCSEDQLDQTWVTVFGFPPAAASYILMQFAQYGNILKHKCPYPRHAESNTAVWSTDVTMASPGNWMHLQYQSKLQARKALSKDGKVFGDCIMVGVKPCIDKSVMGSCEAISSPLSSSVLPSTPQSAIRPLSASYRSVASDFEVVLDLWLVVKHLLFTLTRIS
uniref:Nucleoporin NUP53 n=1 Tax=Nothobranchius furzeri TaxID=105023 RepID=A0A8C6M660_NOTFU